MKGLEKLNLPNNDGCYFGEGFLVNCTSLKSLVIPEGTTYIYSNAVKGCSALQYVYIPATVTGIQDQAFDNYKLQIFGWEGTPAQAYADAPNSLIPSRKYNFVDVDIDHTEITLPDTPIYYDGTPMKPAVTVKAGNVELTDNNEYTLSYENNINIGTAKVTVNGAGFIVGSKTLEFTIQPNKDIEVIPAYDSYVYDGKAKKPGVTVKDKYGTINKSRYTVSYSNNKDVGRATITVTIKEPYNCTVKGYFKIIPRKTEITKLKSPKTKQIKVTWKKQATQTTGYKIQYSLKKDFSSSKTVTVKGAKKTSYTIKGLQKKKTYYVRIRTYRTKGGVTVYSQWSKKKSVKTK